MFNLYVNVCPKDAWSWTGSCFLMSLLTFARCEEGFLLKVWWNPQLLNTNRHERSIFFYDRPQMTRLRSEFWGQIFQNKWGFSSASCFLCSILLPDVKSQLLETGSFCPACPPARPCWDALLAGSEGRYFNLFCPVASGISHVYLFKLWGRFFTLQWCFDFREVLFVFVASLVCLLHF